MKLLLDTHALLWWLTNDRRLGPAARRLIEDPGTNVLVSMVSLWEIAVKVRVGKLQADLGEVWASVIEARFDVIDIGIRHLLQVLSLPIPHRDLFDHLLIAQAQVEDAVFLSEDSYVPSYPIRYVTCSG